ncbi:glycosyltransferase family 4 protein [bacterium]|nr:glycosyltransferase family 4 protein [bacterium]
MRILYCANDPVPFPKGAGVRIEATVRALVKAGAELRLVTPRVVKPEGFQETLAGVDHHLVEVGSGEEPFLERAMRFRRGVEAQLQEKWDVFWFRSPWEGWAAREFPGPLVFEAHGFPSMELPHHFPKLYEHPEFLGRLAWEEQVLLQKAQVVLTVSQTGQRFLATRGAAAQKVVVVPNSAPESAFLASGGVRVEPFQVIYTGTLAPWQGLEQLLEALLHLKNRLPVKLSLVGTRKGRWTRPLRQLAQQLRVRSSLEFLGPFAAEQLRAHLMTAHVAVAPLPTDARNTVQGCCPIKIIEFMAAGLPILSTRLPVVQELVEHDVSAWLVRPNSPWALAQGLLRLAQDPELRARLGQAAQERARQSFHREAFDARLAQIVNRLRPR